MYVFGDVVVNLNQSESVVVPIKATISVLVEIVLAVPDVLFDSYTSEQPEGAEVVNVAEAVNAPVPEAQTA